MAAHNYSLRTRVNSPSISVKTPTSASGSRAVSRSPRKPAIYPSTIYLKHIIGTTTAGPSGLACCQATNSFAYCAGSVAVLVTLDAQSRSIHRYFKARPTALASNTPTSYFDPISAHSTPTKRRSVLPSRRGYEETPLGGFGREWLDDGGQTWSARERIKAATCVALSPDGRYLAVGETGYNPRVLLFSTSPSSSNEQPLSIVTDHAIGVRCVAFSPDSRFLATLGDVNDGFLHIWSVNSKTADLKLHSTNKCTTQVHHMTWIGTTIVTVGTRHVKVWQLSSPDRTLLRKKSRLRLDGEVMPSPGPVPLHGRNCLLGKLADSTFTAVAAVSSDAAVLCTDDGSICRLDLNAGKTDLSTVLESETAMGAICLQESSGQIMWTSDTGDVQTCACVSNPTPTESKTSSSDTDCSSLPKHTVRASSSKLSSGTNRSKRARVVALSSLPQHVISIDIDGNIQILQWNGTSKGTAPWRVSSHQELVRGIQVLKVEDNLGDFFTWARNGEIRFWTIAGELLRSEVCELDEASFGDSAGMNELKIVRYLRGTNQFITGDRYGVLKLLKHNAWTVEQVVRGHSAEVSDIATHEASSLLATCGRDRMIQLFRLSGTGLVLIQTLDEHISAVQHVCFTTTGHRLLSCSTDRTVVIREKMERETDGEILTAYLSARVVTLKASPLSMALVPQDQNTLVVSTMDRHVVRVDVASGSVLEAFKVGDKDTDDTSILNKICLSSPYQDEDHTLVVGFSSIDKSIRVYDSQKGTLYGRESGHTEGVSDIVLLESRTPEDGTQRTVISTGLDSTIMIWSLSSPSVPALTPLHELSHEEAYQYESDFSPAKASPASLPPLRKVLSKVDVAEFVRQTSPSREPSPHRLRRKTSRLAFATSIEEHDEKPSPAFSRMRSTDDNESVEKRSPSPPARPVRPVKQRSRTEIVGAYDQPRPDYLRRSPSPPPTANSTPSTPKYQRANNGRLRRPPSVPTDLRAQAAAQQRRQSMSTANDFGTVGMASEQACRMLRTYRKKLSSNRGDLDLEQIQYELEATLRTVVQKREKAITHTVGSPDILNERMSGEVEELTMLLQNTTVKS